MPEINRDVIQELEQITKEKFKYLKFKFFDFVEDRISLISGVIC